MFSQSNDYSAQSAPPVVRLTTTLLLIVALASAVTEHLFGRWLGIFSPEYFLSLTPFGIGHHFYWQLLTYLFVIPPPLTIQWAFGLAMSVYLVWTVGSTLVERFGARPIGRMALLSSLVGGGLGALLLAISPLAEPLAGPTPLVMALLVGWLITSGSQPILLFHAIPVKIKTVVLALIGIKFFTDLTELNITAILAQMGAIVSAYLYAIIAWNERSPFQRFHSFEMKLSRIGVRWKERKIAKRRG